MKNVLNSVALIAIVGLASCSGGGGGGNAPADEVGNGGGTVSAGPASDSPEDLVRWATDGGKPVYNQYIDNNGMTRIERTAMVDGKAISVTVDEMPNGDYGLIQYDSGVGKNLYTLDDDLVASMDVPEGSYFGALDVDYSTDGGKSWTVASGDITMQLDLTTGTVSYGGMASAENGSVGFYGDASVQNGVFVDNQGSSIFRDSKGQAIATADNANVNGKFIGSGDKAGAVGLVNSEVGDFKSTGGFSMTHNPNPPK